MNEMTALDWAEAFDAQKTLKSTKMILDSALTPGGVATDRVHLELSKKQIAMLAVLVDEVLGDPLSDAGELNK